MTTVKKKPASRKNPVAAKAPTPAELNAELGAAAPVWDGVLAAVQSLVPCVLEWRPAKAVAFGSYGVLRQKDRNLIYLLPRPGAVEVRVMLGDRAFALAMAAKLPVRIKKLMAEAKVYPEGHYIPFAPAALEDVSGIVTLLECKLAK